MLIVKKGIDFSDVLCYDVNDILCLCMVSIKFMEDFEK